MINRRFTLALAIIVPVFLLLLAGPIIAMTISGGAVLTCAGFVPSPNPLALTANRDTVGAGINFEIFQLVGTDGVGNTIYNATNAGTGWNFNSPFGIAFPWNTAPAFNPLRLEAISLAGNGLPEQRVVVATGACAGLADAPTNSDNQGAAGKAAPHYICRTGDGRINDADDCGAPVAIYCTGDAIDIYAINPATAEGSLVIRASYSEIESIGVPKDANITLLRSGNIILARLTTGEFQVNAVYADGKPYIVTWDACPPANLYYQAR